MTSHFLNETKHRPNVIMLAAAKDALIRKTLEAFGGSSDATAWPSETLESAGLARAESSIHETAHSRGENGRVEELQSQLSRANERVRSMTEVLLVKHTVDQRDACTQTDDDRGGSLLEEIQEDCFVANEEKIQLRMRVLQLEEELRRVGIHRSDGSLTEERNLRARIDAESVYRATLECEMAAIQAGLEESNRKLEHHRLCLYESLAILETFDERDPRPFLRSLVDTIISAMNVVEKQEASMVHSELVASHKAAQAAGKLADDNARLKMMNNSLQDQLESSLRVTAASAEHAAACEAVLASVRDECYSWTDRALAAEAHVVSLQNRVHLLELSAHREAARRCIGRHTELDAACGTSTAT